jgi:hypothetical protein
MTTNIIITSLFCTGVHMVFKEGFLLDCVGNLLRARLPHWISSPLFDCLVCMGGFWGATGLFFLTMDWKSIFFFPCVIGLNAIINGLLTKLYENV